MGLAVGQQRGDEVGLGDSALGVGGGGPHLEFGSESVAKIVHSSTVVVETPESATADIGSGLQTVVELSE